MWCVIIPTYNNARTICRVVTAVKEYARNVIVVNDGSTDETGSLLADMGVTVVDYGRNRGKGYALKAGFKKAIEAGFEYAITLDADGQHEAGDIPVLADAVERHPGCLIVGSRNLKADGMPAKNTFANRFSNFWFWVQTGIRLPDTQTGFRLYPLRKMGNLWWMTSRYEAELEMLVYAAWHGIGIVPVDVRVYYPPERVTHFRPTYDFIRISLLNTVLCFLSVVYGYPAKFIRALRRDNGLHKRQRG